METQDSGNLIYQEINASQQGGVLADG